MSGLLSPHFLEMEALMPAYAVDLETKQQAQTTVGAHPFTVIPFTRI